MADGVGEKRERYANAGLAEYRDAKVLAGTAIRHAELRNGGYRR